MNNQEETTTEKITPEDAEFHKWIGVIERTPEYFSTKGDIVIQGVPKRLYECLSERFDFFKTALEERKKYVDYEDDFVWSNNIRDWESAKKQSFKESKRLDRLVIWSNFNDIINGKPQLMDDKKMNNIVLAIKGEKKDKETDEIKQKIKFIGEGFDKRFDGREVEILDKSYWVYNVIDEGKEYIVLCENKIGSSEIHKFYGMKVKVNNIHEFAKDFKCKGTKEIFFCKYVEPSIKAIPQEKIIDYVAEFMLKNGFDNEFMKNFFFDLIFTHSDGNIYRQPEEYMLFRHAHLLSGKSDGYPLSTLSLGVPGCSKTMEIECLEHIFGEAVMEAGNSTVKSLVPSFKENPASPGFIMNQNRVALIDELVKMIDKQMEGNGSTSIIKNQLSQLNYILEHKVRSVGSGNNNTFTGQATAKTIMVGNPAGRMRFLREHLKTIDESTLSRLFIWIKDSKHKEFIQGNNILKSRDTYLTHIHTYRGERQNIGVNGGLGYIRYGIVFRDFVYNFYLSIYDSCQAFTVIIDDEKVRDFFREVSCLIPNELKNVWEARGLHHTRLIIDGITKFRCIFEDLDNKFEAIEKDYDNAERILIKMANSWSCSLRPEMM